MIQYTQAEFLDIIKQYNSIDRSVIKAHLKRLMSEYNIKSGDIISLGFKGNNVYGWTNQGSNNIPMFDQILTICVKWNFDIRELLKNI